MAEQEQRAEELMAKGPVWLVRRVMELEEALADALPFLVCAPELKARMRRTAEEDD